MVGYTMSQKDSNKRGHKTDLVVFMRMLPFRAENLSGPRLAKHLLQPLNL